MQTRGFLVMLACLMAAPDFAAAQMRPAPHTLAFPSAAKLRRESAGPLDGAWMYRSYRALPNLVVGDDPAKALQLLFGEGVMTLSAVGGKVTGTFDMGGGYVLDLNGTAELLADGDMLIRLSGPGRPNSPTAGWEYDYRGYLMPNWPNGIGQVPAIVGSVIRAKPHGTSPAGYVAEFIAVKR